MSNPPVGVDHTLVAAYLERVDRAAADLSADQRASLRRDLLEHLAETFGDAHEPSESTIREALAELGTPEEVVAEASGESIVPPEPGTEPTPGRAPVETTALVLLLLAPLSIISSLTILFAPFLWLAGVLLLALARRWTVGDKALGMLSLGVLGYPLVMTSLFAGSWSSSCSVSGGTGLPTTEVCTGGPPSWVEPTALVVGAVLIGLWTWTALRLWRRARAGRPAPTKGFHMTPLRRT